MKKAGGFVQISNARGVEGEGGGGIFDLMVLISRAMETKTESPSNDLFSRSSLQNAAGRGAEGSLPSSRGR